MEIIITQWEALDSYLDLEATHNQFSAEGP